MTLGAGAGGSGGNTGAGDGSGTGAGGSSGGSANTGAGTGGASSTGAGAPGQSTGEKGGQAGAGGAGLGNGGAGSSATWRDGLPDDLKNDATLGKYSDLTNLAKAHVELQKLIGQKNAGAIHKPAKDASPEEIKAFRESMGIPTDPTKYEMGEFKDIKVDPSIVQWAQKIGVEHGVDPVAMKAIIADYMKIDAQNSTVLQDASQKEMKAGLDGLKTEWGEAFDQNIKRANFAAQKLGGQPLVDALVKLKVENNPMILKAFAEASKLYAEDHLREGGVGSGRQTPAELDGEISSVQQQMFSMKASDGRYPGLKARYESLWKQKTGGR